MDDIQSLIDELRFGAENGADAELLERAADKIQELVADLGVHFCFCCQVEIEEISVVFDPEIGVVVPRDRFQHSRHFFSQQKKVNGFFFRKCFENSNSFCLL